MSAKAKTIVKGYAKKLREDVTFNRRTGAEIVELAVVVAKRKHPDEIFEGADAYKSKEHGYWTLERCQEDAMRFQTRKAWAVGSAAGYTPAAKKGWLDLCCAHMTSLQKPVGYWTLERCQEDAMRFETRKAWEDESPSGYSAACRNGWLEPCCAHMTYAHTPAGYWTLARCQEDAKQYPTRAAWRKTGSRGYGAASSKGWLDQCCAHMTLGRTPNGYWTLERCQEDAMRFQTKAAWRKGGPRGYGAASGKGWLDQCCAHMTFDRVPDGYWTLERCQEDAKRFQTRVAWYRGSLEGKHNGYAAASSKGWLDLCCAHMTSDRMPDGYWTLARCKADAASFQTRKEWQTGGRAGYQAAQKNGWLELCCSHMTSRYKPRGYWTLERCAEDAKPFQTRGAWQKGSLMGYNSAHRSGWLDQCCAHMAPSRTGKKRKDNQ